MDAFITEKSKDYSLLDNQTGEIIEYRKTRKVSMEEFMLFFFHSYSDMFVLTGTQIKVLMCCWRYSAYNPKNCKDGNIVHNDTAFKEACRRDGLKSTDSVIDNCISQLTKYGFLIKICKGAYKLNHEYFFKGTLSDRTKIQYSLMVEPEVKERQQTVAELNRMFSQQA